MQIDYTPKDIQRFWSKVDKSGGPDACWIWAAGKTAAGYGELGIHKHIVYSHRLAWILTYGEIHDGLCVCHKCDNPPCCNPDHLFLGTASDNATDMVKKGRNFVPKEFAPQGEKHSHHKLTELQVLEIRKRYFVEKEMQKTLAREFGVSPSCIEYVVGRGWKCLGSHP
jgi:hypothetical protein